MSDDQVRLVRPDDLLNGELRLTNLALAAASDAVAFVMDGDFPAPHLPTQPVQVVPDPAGTGRTTVTLAGVQSSPVAGTSAPVVPAPDRTQVVVGAIGWSTARRRAPTPSRYGCPRPVRSPS